MCRLFPFDRRKTRLRPQERQQRVDARTCPRNSAIDTLLSEQQSPLQTQIKTSRKQWLSELSETGQIDEVIKCRNHNRLGGLMCVNHDLLLDSQVSQVSTRA